MDRKDPHELQKHMLGTYHSLRVGLVVISVALPLVVAGAGGVLHHVWLKPSISQYYHATARLPFLTTRDLFVGGLLAAAACLYLYKGFSTRENVALNLGGVFAAFVAALPTAATQADRGLVSRLHAASAVLFFLCIAYVSVFRARDTLRLLSPEKRPLYARWYLWTGVAMVLSPLAAVALSYILDQESQSTLVFWVETFGVWAFAAFWFIKSREMRASKAEELALDAKLKREVVPTTQTSDAGTPTVGGASGALLRAVTPKSGMVERILPAQ